MIETTRKNLGTLRAGYDNWFVRPVESPLSRTHTVSAGQPWPYDPLGYGTSLPETGKYFPLGYPVEVSTNSESVLLAAEESWSGYPQYFTAHPLQIRVVVDPEGPAAHGLRMSGQNHLLALVSDPQNYSICDSSRGFAFCKLTAATVADRAWVRYMCLDPMVNMTLWQTHLTRIHAGCVARAGRGVLLCGESGAGKSCLTYACARRGWTFISDEAPSVVRRSDERIVIGKPQLIHLREPAFDLFPELRGRPAKPNPVGKISIQVRTAELPGVRVAYSCHVAALVYLSRRPGANARLNPLAKEEVWNRLASDLVYFGQPAHDENSDALRSLLGAQTYELRYDDFDSAIDQLERMIDRGSGW